MVKTLERIVFGARTYILIAIALFTIAMGYFATGLKTDAGISKMWPLHHEYVDTFNQYQASLPGAKRIIVVLHANSDQPGSIWTPEFLATLNGVTQDLFFIPGIDRKTVTSLWTPNTRFFEITEEGISADDVIGGTTTAGTVGAPGRIEKIQNNVIRGGFVGRLVSNDFTAAMVTAEILEFDPSTGEKLDFADFGKRLETTIRERFEEPGGPALWYVDQRLEELRAAETAKAHDNVTDLAQAQADLAAFKDTGDAESAANKKALEDKIATLTKAIADCPAPSGFMHWVETKFEGETFVSPCGDYADGVKKQLGTMELNYGPVVGSYYPTFKTKLDEIIAQKLPATDQYTALKSEIATWKDAVKNEPAPFKVHIIGTAKALSDIIEGAKEVIKFFAVAFFLTVAAVWWYCRSWSLTLLTVGCSLVSVFWQFGIIALLGFGLDPLAILVPFLVFAIGVSHGIQQMNLLTDGLSQGMSSEQAARYSFSGLLIPGSMALTTALVGFATLYLVPIPMVKELAIASSIGVALKIVTNLIMLPLIASLMKFKGDYRAIVTRQRDRAKGLVHLLGGIAEPKVAMPFFAVSLVLLGLAVFFGLQRQIGDVHAGMPELKADHRYNYDARTVSTKFNQALDLFTVIVEAPPQACIKYPYMEYMNRFTWYLRNVPGVVSAVSVAELAKQLNAGWYEGNLKWRGLPHNQYSLVQATSPIPSTAGVLNSECTLLPIHLFLANGKAETIAPVVAAVKAWRETKSIPPALNKGTDNLNGSWTLTPAELDGLTYSAQLHDDDDPAEIPLTVTTFNTDALPMNDDVWTVLADQLANLVLTPADGTVPGHQVTLSVAAVKGTGDAREVIAAADLKLDARKAGGRVPVDVLSVFAGKDVSAATAFEIGSLEGGSLGHRTQIFTGQVPWTLGAPGIAQPLDGAVKKLLEGQDLAKVTEIEIAGTQPSLYIRLAAGNSGIAAAVNEEIEEQELPMTLIVYAVIILLVIFTFLDWRATLCCTVPLTFATFFGYWFMHIMGIGLKVSTLPVMVLAVGIGVDYAFYIYDRLQHFLAEGDDITTAYKKTMDKTGMAVVFTAITLAIGVSTWSFSDLKFQADMGMLLTFMFLINMLNAVTVLPAMAVTLDKLIPRRSRPKLHGLAAAEPHEAMH
ncbi:Multidrug resistance protein MdtC [Alphaproteobacteria bacterium SO-S41]|nr:Multidrug resistance protein MdtC [Alphaproteobacteria bacterium SO-S41]